MSNDTPETKNFTIGVPTHQWDYFCDLMNRFKKQKPFQTQTIDHLMDLIEFKNSNESITLSLSDTFMNAFLDILLDETDFVVADRLKALNNMEFYRLYKALNVFGTVLCTRALIDIFEITYDRVNDCYVAHHGADEFVIQGSHFHDHYKTIDGDTIFTTCRNSDNSNYTVQWNFSTRGN